MRNKLILILAFVLILGSISTGYAAEEQNDDVTVITLEEAKSLVKEYSRTLQKYELNVKKAKYQQQQTEAEQDDIYDTYNSLSSRYTALSEQYAQPDLDADTAEQIAADMEKLEAQMESQYKSIESSSDSIEDAENNYDDAVSAEENYRKQIDYIVEDLYTSILNQQGELEKLTKEYELMQYRLDNERKKLGLGTGSQYQVDDLAAALNDLEQKITQQENAVKIKKGQLNDMMGRSYDDALELVSFEVSGTIDIPDYQQLLSSATYANDTLSQLKRDLNDLEDDYDEEDDYYRYLILAQEVKQKELELEDAKINLTDYINNLITDVKLKQQDYQLAQINLRNAERSYQWAEKRYQLGQISKLALLESEISYINAKNQMRSAGYSLSLAQQALELANYGILI